jgi:HSP20 family protein
MQQLHHQLNTLLDASLGRRPDGGQGFPFSEWEPAVDIVEDKNGYIIQADLPGVRRHDVSVTFENGVLRLAGERKPAGQPKDRRQHRLECPSGKFHRTFMLPGDITPGLIHADFRDGVLFVYAPKSKSAKPKSRLR